MNAQEITYHKRLVIAVEAVFKLFTFTSFALRLWVRYMSKAKFWWDDYTMAIGLVFAWVPGICSLISLHYGFGQHAAQNSENHIGDMRPFLILFYISQLAYVSTIPIVKISVLFFYHRIFPQTVFRWATYGMGVCLVLFLISSWLVTSLQCLPVHSFWEPEVSHHCIDRPKYFVAHGSLDFVMDLTIVMMPIPILKRMRLPRHKKFGLILLFLLGGLSCGMALGRIIALKRTNPNDIASTGFSAVLWFSLIAQVIVLSGNLPLLKPLFLQTVAVLRRRYYKNKAPADDDTYELYFKNNSKSPNRLHQSKENSSDSLKSSTLAVADDLTNSSKNGGWTEELANDKIEVERDLEQSMESLGAIIPAHPRES